MVSLLAIALLAVSASAKDRAKWAVFCPGECLAIGFTQHNAKIASPSRWFASQISSLCLSLSGSTVSSTLKAMRLWVRALKTTSGPIALQKAVPLSPTFNQAAVLLFSTSIRMPRCFWGSTERIPLPLSLRHSSTLLSSLFSWIAFIAPTFEHELPCSDTSPWCQCGVCMRRRIDQGFCKCLGYMVGLARSDSWDRAGLG